MYNSSGFIKKHLCLLLCAVFLLLLPGCSSKKQVMLEVKPVGFPVIKKTAAVLRVYDNTDFSNKVKALGMLYAGDSVPYCDDISGLDSDTAELLSSYRINKANYYLLMNENLDDEGRQDLVNLRSVIDQQEAGLIGAGIEDPDRYANIGFALEGDNPAGSYDSALSEAASAIITTNLDRSNMFILLERQRIDDIMSEQKLAEDGILDSRSVRTAGNLLNAEVLFMGNISNFLLERKHVESVVPTGALLYLTVWAISGKEPKSARDMIWYTDHLDVKNYKLKCSVDLRAVDAVTGEVLYAQKSEAEESVTTVYISDIGGGVEYSAKLAYRILERAVTNAVYHMLEQIVVQPFRGRIADVSDGHVYINAGRLQNVKTGDRFEVFSSDALVEDPVNGLLLGFENDSGCFIEVLEADELFSKAVLTPESECDVEKGDYIEFSESSI